MIPLKANFGKGLDLLLLNMFLSLGTTHFFNFSQKNNLYHMLFYMYLSVILKFTFYPPQCLSFHELWVSCPACILFLIFYKWRQKISSKGERMQGLTRTPTCYNFKVLTQTTINLTTVYILSTNVLQVAFSSLTWTSRGRKRVCVGGRKDEPTWLGRRAIGSFPVGWWERQCLASILENPLSSCPHRIARPCLHFWRPPACSSLFDFISLKINGICA